MDNDQWEPPAILVAVDLVILTLHAATLKVLLIKRGVDPFRGEQALPGGFLRDDQEDLPSAALRELSEEAGLDIDELHLEQLGVYGDPGRDPRGRVISVAFLVISARLPDPVAGTDAMGARWIPADHVLSAKTTLAFDHRQIVVDGVERARQKIEHSTLATAFCGQTFTLTELQQVYEAVWGMPLDPRNFYRKIKRASGFVVEDGPTRKYQKGRPARLFRAGPRKVLYPPMVRAGLTTDTEGRRQMAGEIVVVLTAFDLEYQAVRHQLTDIRPQAHAGTRFEVGLLRKSGHRIAIALVGKGNHAAAALTERAIEFFDPVAVVLVGVAGALYPGVALGDLVVATHIYAYHGGTSMDDGMKSRPRVWETAHGAIQVAQHLKMSGDWTRHLPTTVSVPQIHFAPIAAGEVVQDSMISAQADWVREHYNDALAIEMEAAGVAQAGHLSGAPIVVVRGISDRADGSKTVTDRARWQERAVTSAAAFGVALASALIRESTTVHARHGKKRGDPMSQQFNNTANDNANIGIMVGQVNGNLYSGSGSDAPPHDLARQISDLRVELHRARERGELERDYCAAAEHELDVVDEALPVDTPERRTVAMMSLLKLRGLVGGIADLVGKVTAIITAIKGVS
jgi:nucleoside phosphorylase/ADP-ribose pyrophosphatase YjhB (NUDIX family)